MNYAEANEIVKRAADILGWSPERVAAELSVTSDALRSWRNGTTRNKVHRRNAASLERLLRRVERVEAGR